MKDQVEALLFPLVNVRRDKVLLRGPLETDHRNAVSASPHKLWRVEADLWLGLVAQNPGPAFKYIFATGQRMPSWM